MKIPKRYWAVLVGGIFGLMGCVGISEKNAIIETVGNETTLQTRLLKHAVYDGSDGKTELAMFSTSNRKKLKNMKWDGVWHCLGYIKARKYYLLVGEFQTGAFLPLLRMKYLSADGNVTLDSRYRWNFPKSDSESHGWMGFGAVPNPDLSFVAFVGCLDESPMSVMILDTQKDEMKVLGRAPAPPPIKDPHWREEALKHPLNDWVWGGPSVDGFEEMDAGVIEFDKDKVTVSYGDDTPVKRADKRIFKTWDLKKVFQ
jgi:hypothetical protein